jgi:PKD repeat protein
MKTSNPKMSLRVLFIALGMFWASFAGVACNANFTYVAGLNGHYSFTSTSTGVGSGTQYEWNPGDGSGWQYGNTAFRHIYTVNGTYNAKLWISDSSSCNDSITISITVSNVTTPCTLSANFSYTIGAHGVVTFTSTSTGTNANTQYYWTPDDSNLRVQGTTTYTHKYLYQGDYLVWLTLSDTGNAYCMDSNATYIYVGTADSNLCHTHAHFTYTTGSNGEVTFTSTSTGDTTMSNYTWFMGDTVGQYYYAGSTISYTYLFNDTYYVTLILQSDSISCTDTIILPVTITNACNLKADFSYAYDSAGGVKFTSTSQGTNTNTKYYWTFGDSTATVNGMDTITHGYSFIAYYYVTLTDSNANGCTSSITQTVYIYNKDSLKASFVYVADSLNAGEYDFNSTSRGTNANTYYLWTWGDKTPSDSGLGMTTATHTYLHNGPDSATLIIWYTILPKIKTRHSISSYARYDESSYTLVINVTTVITDIKSAADNAQVYNVYPNPNDGLFRIAVNGLEQEKNATIRISNMMGQVIYQSQAAISGGKIHSDINLNTISSGVYMLQIITPNNTYNSKIDVQK